MGGVRHDTVRPDRAEQQSQRAKRNEQPRGEARLCNRVPEPLRHRAFVADRDIGGELAHRRANRAERGRGVGRGSSHDGHLRLGILRERHVEGGLRLVGQIIVLCRTHHADDSEPTGPGVADPAADGIPAFPIALRGGLVDQCHQGGVRLICIAEGTAPDNRNTHGAEEARRHLPAVHRLELIGVRGVAVHPHRAELVGLLERRLTRDGDAPDSRGATQPFQQLPVEHSLPFLHGRGWRREPRVGPAGLRRTDASSHQMLDAEAGIHRENAGEALEQ